MDHTENSGDIKRSLQIQIKSYTQETEHYLNYLYVYKDS